MTTTNQVAEIAGRLTKAQRVVVIDNYFPSPRVGGRIIAPTRRSQRDLFLKGLCGVTGALTPLGLAVRAHLEASDNDR